jgi:hypothetical protein
MILLKYPFKIKGFTLLLGSLFCLLNSISLKSQTNGKQLLDTSKPLLDINNTKIVKKINAVLDSNQKKINTLLFNKIDTNGDGKISPEEMEKARDIIEKHRQENAGT